MPPADRVVSMSNRLSDPLRPQVLRRAKLFEQIVDKLEEAIISGRLQPGEQIPSERELMDLYGVGRTSVREALFSLQKMGFINIGVGSRARVAVPSSEALLNGLSGAVRFVLSKPEGVKQIQDVRLFLEVGLARHAAKEATKAQLRKLGQAVEANLAATETPELDRTDEAFHFTLAKMHGNPMFVTMHVALMGWLSEQRRISIRIPEAATKAQQAHVRIFEGIGARDPDRAETAMREHLSDVSDTYWRAASPSGASPVERRK